jgi:hypothetical protein
MSIEIEIAKKVEVNRWEKPITITLREYYTMKDHIKANDDRIDALCGIVDELRSTMDTIYKITNDYTYCSEAMLEIGCLSRGA